jgi:GWxTD domain-containing protein
MKRLQTPRRWFAFGLLVAAAVAGQAELINPFLGPEYARWLVGAVGEIASDSERDEFLLLEEDEDARRFVESFWAQPSRSGIRDLYQSRYAEADRRFAEGVYPGGRTDRGAIFVLYGEPEAIEYEEFRDIEEPDVEIWRYTKQADLGLDGKKPKRTYRFVKVGDLTRRFERGGEFDPETQRRRRPRSALPPFEGEGSK